MTPDEAIQELLGHGKTPPFVALEATRLAVAALEFLRDHRYLNEPDPTPPKLAGDYFGAEF